MLSYKRNENKLAACLRQLDMKPTMENTTSTLATLSSTLESKCNYKGNQATPIPKRPINTLATLTVAYIEFQS